MTACQRSGFCVLLLSLSVAAWGQPLPVVEPGKVGLSSEKLARISDVMKEHIDEKRMAGFVAIALRRGKIAYFEADGFQDTKSRTPMRKDSIFRIYSMTKPITSVAAMMLYEEGRFALDDPVSKFLPELSDMKVAVEEEEAGKSTFKTVPAQKRITVRDLLRHTSGFTYEFDADSELGKVYRQASADWRQGTIAGMVEKLGTLPLKYQPGTRWEYGVSTDVLGRFVEVVSGQPLDEFFKKRILKPLAMNDTGFRIPKSKRQRFTTLYSLDDDGSLVPSTRGMRYDESTRFFSGGGGLASTVSDYARFCQMLLNGGELGGVRILRRDTVALMTQDQLGSIPRADWMEGEGFGLGFRVALKTHTDGPSKGTYSWGGLASTSFWIDPVEKLITVFMIQIIPDAGNPYGKEFKKLVYEAIAER